MRKASSNLHSCPIGRYAELLARLNKSASTEAAAEKPADDEDKKSDEKNDAEKSDESEKNERGTSR